MKRKIFIHAGEAMFFIHESETVFDFQLNGDLYAIKKTEKRISLCRLYELKRMSGVIEIDDYYMPLLTVNRSDGRVVGHALWSGDGVVFYYHERDGYNIFEAFVNCGGHWFRKGTYKERVTDG